MHLFNGRPHLCILTSATALAPALTPARAFAFHPETLSLPSTTLLLLLPQVGAAAIEIWTMDDGYYFDDVLVSNSGGCWGGPGMVGSHLSGRGRVGAAAWPAWSSRRPAFHRLARSRAGADRIMHASL